MNRLNGLEPSVNGNTRIVNGIALPAKGQKGLAALREEAAALGITSKGKNKYDLIKLITERKKATEKFRRELAARGLSTEGDREELELRLASHKEGGVTAIHRRTYTLVAFTAIVLGFVAMGISIPHISAELVAVMGCPMWAGVLLAITMDGGIASMKAVDTLSSKFEFSPTVRVSVWVLQIVCLAFSALLNYAQFARHIPEASTFAQSLCMATAGFVSVFIFACFYVGSTMVMKCEDKRAVAEKRDADPAAKLAKALDQVGKLMSVADRFGGIGEK